MRYLETTRVGIAELEPFPGNARTHDDAALDESAEVNGQYRSVVARRLGAGLQLLAGHGTVDAFARRGDVDVRVEVIEADDTEARRIVLADNGTSRNAGYDEKLLLELIDQASKDGGLPGTGWDEAAYRELLDSAAWRTPGRDVDDAPNAPDEAVTVLGDVWLLGRHRLMCGDATDESQLRTLLAGTEPGIVYTDPPYGISIVKSNGKIGSGGWIGGKFVPTTKYRQVAGDDSTDTARESFALIHGLFPKAIHVWWGANHYAGSAGMPDASCWIVWDKVNGTNDFADAELAWTNHPGAVRIFQHMWNGMLRATEGGKQRVHPNQKPVALAAWAFELVDPKATRRVVFDVFAGSGGTLIAAEVSGRDARVMELEAPYCDVIARRYQDLTGNRPVLERTGRAWDFTATPACEAA